MNEKLCIHCFCPYNESQWGPKQHIEREKTSTQLLACRSHAHLPLIFQSKHVVYSICMKTERKRERQRSGDGRRFKRDELTPRGTLSLPLCVCVSRSLSRHSFMLFTDSVVSFWRTPWAEEKERACEERDWVRSESWPAGVIFTRMAFSGIWWIGDVSLKFRGHGEYITPPVARGHLTYRSVSACK